MVAFRGFARRGLGVFGVGLCLLAGLSIGGTTTRADEPRCSNCAGHSRPAGETQAGTGVVAFVRGPEKAEPAGKGGWLGIRLGAVSEELRLHLRLPGDQAFLINNVVKGSPAEGRLQRNDIVLAVDGQPASSNLSDFPELMSRKQPGDTLTLTVLRGGERSTLAIKLAARMANPEALKLVYEDENTEEPAVTYPPVPGSKVGTFHVVFSPDSGSQNAWAITKDNKTYLFRTEDKKLEVTVSDLQGKELTKLFTTREDLEKADRQLYQLYQEASANRPQTNVGYIIVKATGKEGQDAKSGERIVVQSITGNLVGGAPLQALLGPGNAPVRPDQPVGGTLKSGTAAKDHEAWEAAEAAERARARTNQPPDLSGTWCGYNPGDTHGYNADGYEPCSITQNGSKLTFKSALGGSRSPSGFLSSPNTIVVPDWGNLVGTLTSTGESQTIHWSNNTWWTRKIIPTMNSPAVGTVSGVMQAPPHPCAGCPMAQAGRPGQPGPGGPATSDARKTREPQETAEVKARLQAELQALQTRLGLPGQGGHEAQEARKARERQEAAEVLERVRTEAQARMGTPEQIEHRAQEAREHARDERARMQPGASFTWEFMPGAGGAMAGRPMTVARPLPSGFSSWVAPAATPSFTVSLNGEITAEVVTPAGSIRKTFANEGDLQNRAPGLFRKYQKLAEELK